MWFANKRKLKRCPDTTIAFDDHNMCTISQIWMLILIIRCPLTSKLKYSRGIHVLDYLDLLRFANG